MTAYTYIIIAKGVKSDKRCELNSMRQ